MGRGAMKAALVIPVYNHAQAIGTVLGESRQLGLPVIVVDDGSTDTTLARIHAYPGITVLRHRVNQGKGAAILTGCREAWRQGYPWAVTMDGDGQHRPMDTLRLLEACSAGCRCLVVGRRLDMARQQGVPWTSRFGRGFSNFWVWAAGGPRLRDSQSGFRLYPLPELFALGVRARRYQFEVEVLVRAHWQGLPIIEVPVEVKYQPAGGHRVSHFHPWLDFCRNAGTFSSLIMRRLLGRARRS